MITAVKHIKNIFYLVEKSTFHVVIWKTKYKKKVNVKNELSNIKTKPIVKLLKVVNVILKD